MGADRNHIRLLRAFTSLLKSDPRLVMGVLNSTNIDVTKNKQKDDENFDQSKTSKSTSSSKKSKKSKKSKSSKKSKNSSSSSRSSSGGDGGSGGGGGGGGDS